MTEPVSSDPALQDESQKFAEDMRDLLARTIVDNPPIQARERNGRVQVAAFEEGRVIGMPLKIAGQTRLEFRVDVWCTWDFTGRFLAIHESEFALVFPGQQEPVVRFDYVRDQRYAPAHIQLHAESSQIGYLLALRENFYRVPTTQAIHLPVGGKRFRPSLEDVIEFAVHEFDVEKKDGWLPRIHEGRRRWELLQVKAAIRDAVRHGRQEAAQELKATIDRALTAVNEHG